MASRPEEETPVTEAVAQHAKQRLRAEAEALAADAADRAEAAKVLRDMEALRRMTPIP